jgi:hypothetical protein
MANEQPTCGQGLAERAALPAKLAELLAALAENLEAHARALVPSDPAATQEHQAYAGLVGDYRALASDLAATARRMVGYRDLPMGAHDRAAMTSPKVRDGFAHYVTTERELAQLLHQMLEADDRMLRSMRK